ncbi:uncharacterized protein LOC125487005 [Rhincodon typus]|uniref:uncharacterized protein LOC125487005 n=1 Tax=Rhincodon typus TaxID=259920 RepID=UPI0020301ECA|nr:uncharacterized protein LOC125487005 [Rhincodon typus]
MGILNEHFRLTKCAFNLLLLSFLLSYCVQIINGNVKMESYCAPGSSMFFPGVDEYERSTAEFYQWKVSNGGTTNGLGTGVLLFHVGATEPSVLNKYTGRLEFFPSNGSFILHHLTSSDAGLYTLSINLRDIIIQDVQLWIIDKLSKSSILSNSSFLHSTIMLTCNVSGQPHEYRWQKDGGNISQYHQLVDGSRSVIISNAGKNDCGTYTCIAINPVSSVQAHYTLTIDDAGCNATNLIWNTLAPLLPIIGIICSVLSATWCYKNYG